MRTLETNAEYFGISLLQLMENAGHHVATEVSSRFQKGESVAIFCGLGGNGGDGFVAARHLANLGFKVAIILSGRGIDISHEAALKNFLALKSMRERISVLEVTDSCLIPNIDAGIIIDGLLGTGTKGKLKPPILQLVEQINSLSGFKIAIDIPTGIDSDSGEVLGNAVKADVTVTFHGLKSGLKPAK